MRSGGRMPLPTVAVHAFVTVRTDAISFKVYLVFTNTIMKSEGIDMLLMSRSVRI